MVSRWVFGRDVSVCDVWAAGAHVVRDARHIARAGIAKRFGDTLRGLLDTSG